MEVEIFSNTILKASNSPPHPLLNSQVPLTIFDRATFNLHLICLHIFKQPMPSNEAMAESFSQVLNLFPHLCGRLTKDERGRPCVLLNNAGVRVVEARVGMTLAECLPLKHPPELKKLYPPSEGVQELTQIQATRYTCGGLIVGFTYHHLIADGHSMSNFILAFTKQFQGLKIDTLPYHDRAAVIVPRNPPVCEFNHRAMEFRERPTPAAAATSTTTTSPPSSFENLAVHFSSEFMTKLRTHVRDVDPGRQRYSSFECLLAHLWKKITVARGLNENEFTQVRVAVDGRERMRPAVPMEYFGNLVLWACPRLRVKDLLNESYAFVARTIREAVNKVDSAYFQSFIDFGELLTVEEEEALVPAAPQLGSLQSPNLQVDSWLRFQIHGPNLGDNGTPELLIPQLPAEGMLFFAPSSKERGGLAAFVALQHHHADHFKQISHSLPAEAELSLGPQKSLL